MVDQVLLREREVVVFHQITPKASWAEKVPKVGG